MAIKTLVGDIATLTPEQIAAFSEEYAAATVTEQLTWLLDAIDSSEFTRETGDVLRLHCPPVRAMTMRMQSLKPWNVELTNEEYHAAIN
jgi:hypothetical protein